jgi:hypothetical protein
MSESTNGAPAANAKASGGKTAKESTTPLRARSRPKRGAKDTEAQESDKGKGESMQKVEEGLKDTMGTQDSTPGSIVGLKEISFPIAEKPLMKPIKVYGEATWDGLGVTKYDEALRCIQFWKRLRQAVRDCQWSSAYAWLYVVSFGLKEPLKSKVIEEAEDMSSLQEFLEREYLLDITVAEIVAPVYQVVQGEYQSIQEYYHGAWSQWVMVQELIQSQEQAVVAIWVGKIRPGWAKNNQAIYLQLREQGTWKGVKNVVDSAKGSINERSGSRGGMSKIQSEQKPKEGKSGTPVVRKNGPGCWICGEPGHVKRDCPKKATTKSVSAAPKTEASDQGNVEGEDQE